MVNDKRHCKLCGHSAAVAPNHPKYPAVMKKYGICKRCFDNIRRGIPITHQDSYKYPWQTHCDWCGKPLEVPHNATIGYCNSTCREKVYREIRSNKLLLTKIITKQSLWIKATVS